ncbi:hypothetical protein GJ496_008554 [Pomphorhynchus laevis]|nr:hypothetical protein GJ496_008554 [Pomphorhynchus laevis]
MPSSILHCHIDDSNISSSTNINVSILTNLSYKHTTSNNAKYVSERTNSSCFKLSNATLNNKHNRIRCSYSSNYSSNPRCFYKSNGTKLKFPNRKRCVFVSGIADSNSLNSATRIERDLAAVKPYWRHYLIIMRGTLFLISA